MSMMCDDDDDIPVKTPEQLVAEIRNRTLDEVAESFKQFKPAFGNDTIASFQIFVRAMKT